jgi:hypothetical protein
VAGYGGSIMPIGSQHTPDQRQTPWNKGRHIGQKRPLKPKDIWTIRVRLQLVQQQRDLAMFNLAIDSKLRGCDLVRLRIDDVSTGGRVRERTTVAQKKTMAGARNCRPSGLWRASQGTAASMSMRLYGCNALKSPPKTHRRRQGTHRSRNGLPATRGRAPHQRRRQDRPSV